METMTLVTATAVGEVVSAASRPTGTYVAPKEVWPAEYDPEDM